MGAGRFRVGISPDLRGPDGKPSLDLGLRLLEEVEEVEWELIEDRGVVALEPGQVRDFDAVLLADTSVVRSTLDGVERLAHIARLGVGFDDLDLEGCTERGIVITNAPDGVRRPMAVSAILLVLALAHRLLEKDRLARSGGWEEQWSYLGTGVTGVTLGLVGAGNIGQEICRLAKPFEIETIAFDPYVDEATAASVGFRLVDLETLMSSADFVCVCCPLNDQTRHLVDAERLALMKPSAYLVNLARGPIVDESALVAALESGRIQGAGLDVYEQEPVDPDNPLLRRDNVIATPHCIGHTDEIFRACGEIGCRNMLAVARGEVPQNVVNPGVLDNPTFRRRLAEPRLERRERGERTL
jgi:phosphoglycerate dehydrogenase-like enzyme